MLDHLRQQQRRQTEAVEDDILAQYPSGEPALEQLAIDSQLLQLLQQALADMPPRTQQIFRLNRLDGLTQAQVAAQLGVSLSTVEKHLASALERLMARMEEQ